MKLCVFGGTGATGSNVIQVAKSKGYSIVASTRRPEVLKARFPDIQVVPGDVFEPETIRAPVVDSDAIISTLGPAGRSRETAIYSKGLVNIAETMRETGKRRLIAVASLIALDPQPDLSWYTDLLGKIILMPILGYQYRDAAKMKERLIKLEDLDWTLVGVPRLTNAKARGRHRASVGAPLHRPSQISRADLADYLVTIIGESATYKRWTEVSW